MQPFRLTRREDVPRSDMNEEDRPKYFHLLSDREVKSLRPVMELLRDQRPSILSRWHELYEEHFGASRALPEAVFRDVYGRDLDAIVENLLDPDMDGFEADVSSVGYELVERRVPFAEVVASLHLFEESCTAQFQRKPELQREAPAIYLTFDKLSHCRMILLSRAYFDAHHADTAARVQGLEREVDRLAIGGAVERTRFHGLVGGSVAMRRIYGEIGLVAGGHGAVFIVGESGTGKELVARAIHESGSTTERPFIAVNCAALPRELIESELFGHRRGAYTGATTEYPGLIRAASGGTLFLDEITEMATETQAKLLRVLEERTVRPVGTAHELPIDVRYIASTNRDPNEALKSGLLRKDLYYRLNVHRIALPPLRDRLDDIPLLAEHFLSVFARRGLRKIAGIEQSALSSLASHEWPGNVRELRNAIEYALTVGKTEWIRDSDLPQHVMRLPRTLQSANESAISPDDRIPTLEEAERTLIRRALEVTDGNKLLAARMLRISRHRLYDRLRKYALGS